MYICNVYLFYFVLHHPIARLSLSFSVYGCVWPCVVCLSIIELNSIQILFNFIFGFSLNVNTIVFVSCLLSVLYMYIEFVVYAPSALLNIVFRLPASIIMYINIDNDLTMPLLPRWVCWITCTLSLERSLTVGLIALYKQFRRCKAGLLWLVAIFVAFGMAVLGRVMLMFRGKFRWKCTHKHIRYIHTYKHTHLRTWLFCLSEK